VKRKAGAVLVPGFLILALLLTWLDQHPVRLPTTGPRVAATINPRNHGHPVLLVVDFEGLRASGPRRLGDRWPDLEWGNILTQGFGGCDITDLADLETALGDRELVVLGRRTARGISPVQLRTLSSRVDEGLNVLIEAPDSSLCREFGLELAAVERRGRLPWPRPVIPMGELAPSLRPEPIAVAWTRMRYAPQPLVEDARPRVHLSLDGRPMGWVKGQGEGAWIVLAMDFAELSTRLRQGAPSEDLTLRAGPGELEPATHDLVASPELLAADQAWLDVWVEGICGAALTSTPIARIAAAPWSADGWLILGEHHAVPAPSSGRARDEFPAPVSVFALAPPPGSTVRHPVDGLLARWPGPTLFADRASNPVHEIGLGSLHPFARPPSVAEQREALTQSAGTAPTISRTLRGLWSRAPDRCFEEIVGAGFETDTSFGPAPSSAGWLFGSGVPFVPLATTGLAFALTEIPFHASVTDQPLDLRRISRWMRRNAEGGGGPIQLAGVFGDADLKSGDLAALMDRHRHLAATAPELVEWWKHRSQILLRSRPTDEGVEISIGETSGTPTAILVPVRWRDRSLAGWDADWGVARSRKTRRFDRGYRLLELDARAGGGRLRLRYR
jgi:hypothetical protein